MAATVVHKLDQAALKTLLSGKDGPVARDLLRRGLKVETAAKMNLEKPPRRVDTGRLRASVNTQLYLVADRLVCGIGTNVNYALMVHDGTGLYGPHAALIDPGHVMRWKSKSYGAKKGKYQGYAFATTTKGMRPNPFLKDALPAAKG